nr:fibronectin type III domain-containing protein 5 isoform X1 [Pelodiscus sinensis]XP_014426193.1 fibronectin type III domain-containing protein 5 isoform X1 [Pelodiscus sinensis]XP_014426194.1 fibronectin type III domain-containing protein 5 isoform X1 [Pelodiscus sinensis]|eukprot:XP_006117588.1 fibronectin type III domain-containing protein 5 isoform X1 [Pelodiscus sinensis]
MLRFIQEVNTTTRSCALWDLEEDTEYIVHVQSISIQGQSPASEPVLFKTPREAEKLASKNKDEVTMKEMGKNQQLRAGEILIIVVVLFMWAGVIALFCRQYDIIKDNEPNNNKEKAKSPSESSTPEHQGGGLLRSKIQMLPSTFISIVLNIQGDGGGYPWLGRWTAALRWSPETDGKGLGCNLAA